MKNTLYFMNFYPNSPKRSFEAKMASAPLAMVGVLVLAFIAHAAFISGKTTVMIGTCAFILPFFIMSFESN